MLPYITPDDPNTDPVLKNHAWRMCVFAELLRCGVTEKEVTLHPNTEDPALHAMLALAACMQSPYGPDSRPPDARLRVHVADYTPVDRSFYAYLRCLPAPALYCSDVAWGELVREATGCEVRLAFPSRGRVFIIDPTAPMVSEATSHNGYLVLNPYEREYDPVREVIQPLEEALRAATGLGPAAESPSWERIVSWLKEGSWPVDFAEVLHLTEGDPWRLFPAVIEGARRP